MPTSHSVSEKLCLTCGLCCNGVIFADVQLQSGDDVQRLETLGLPVAKRTTARGIEFKGEKYKFPQPCSAFDGCRCQTYSERPKHCRAFDCALLKSVQLGETKPANALRTIERARARAEKMREYLRLLGNTDERVALSLRFRSTAQRLQETQRTPKMADTFSQLTLAAHDLNLLLSEKFYPG